LSAVARGLIAGGIGTVAMDALWFVRYRRRGGGSDFAAWEFSSGVSSWDEAPAPARLGKRLVEGLFKRELSLRREPLVNNITHWGYGMLSGAQYGLVTRSLPIPRIRYGLPFGAAAWASSYVVLPIAKVYKPIWEYDVNTLAKDLTAHLVYGVSTGTALRLLTPTD
jgi:hypothetical protein